MPTVRNRVPRVRPGAPRDWTRLDRHERAVIDALYRAPVGMTFADLHAETRIGKAPLLATLKALCDRTRCTRLGSSGPAVDRTDRPLPSAPLYAVTPQWLLTRRPHGLRS